MTSQPEIAQRSAGRALLPREHGAYLELLFSLSTALALGSLHAAQLLLAAGAIAAFFAHEPVVVMLGDRGRRMFDQFKDRAALTAAALLAIAAIGGVGGWWCAPPAARAAILLPLFFTALLVPTILSRREKTSVGQLLLALTFASAVIPIAVAGGASLNVAATASSVWAAIFSIQTLTVRRIRGSAKENRDSRRVFSSVIVVNFGALLAAWFLAIAGILPPLAAAALIPTALTALTCTWMSVHPRHLRRIGWSFAASSLLALVSLLAALR